jgi:HEAT repeat protein
MEDCKEKEEAAERRCARDKADAIEVASGAAAALGRIEAPAATDALLQQLPRAGSSRLRASIVGALGSKPDPRSRDAVLGAAGDKEQEVRRAAAESLGTLSATLYNDQVRQQLETLAAKDPAPEVRRAAVQAIHQGPK